MREVLSLCCDKPGDIETILVKKTTERKEDLWTYWEVTRVHGQENNGTAYVCIGYDVSESEKAHLQARAYARQIETIIDNLPNSFLILDSSLNIARTNYATQKLLNADSGELLGGSFWDWFGNTKSGVLEHALADAKELTSALRLEEYFPKHRAWYEITLYATEGNSVTLILKDITEKKKVEENIRESEDKLRAIMDSTSDFNMLIGPDLNILSYNKAALETTRQIYGRNLEVGQSVLDYILPGTVDEFKQNFALAMTGETQEVKVKLNFRDDLVLWFQVRYYPVYATDGKLIGVAFNSTNIDKLQRQYERLSEIARLYSHEIRRPVATILGITQLINQNQLSLENREWFNYLKSTTQQLDSVIHSIVEKTVEIEMDEK
jgi:PAS domain S-box-containing protein